MLSHTFVVLAYKESEYLETCIKSVLNQKFKSNVVISTSTPNEYIDSLAKKYNLQIIVNPNPGRGIGYDFDFARTCVESDLVTIAHQDDVYDENYSFEVINAFKQYPDSSIVFTDYFELRNNKKVYENRNLKIKRLLLKPLNLKKISSLKFIKRIVLALGDPICCPAVTFGSNNILIDDVFACNLKCDVDWHAWELLSKQNGRFLFINKSLMGHRIHEDSTTSEIIENNIRTEEDLIILKEFWPEFIAKKIAKIYAGSEKSNDV